MEFDLRTCWRRLVAQVINSCNNTSLVTLVAVHVEQFRPPLLCPYTCGVRVVLALAPL
ncbi:hypothetical protein J6590_100757 [Homalodisca vitripennis]|nr:hypothetical protein J6590_072903 [Homalodisca vitripennis]KAG8304168.1 hypothetical protein J6590_100757 [Homalodisca vitripennis]